MGTSASSDSDAAQLEKGSGDRLIAARAPAFAACIAAARLPPRIAAATMTALLESPNAIAASAAPAGMRMKLCTASHMLSSQGSLSAPNSTSVIKPLAASTTGCCSTSRWPGSSTQPRAPANPTAKITA